MIYELRVYRALPGRMPALLKRFETRTLKIWERMDIQQVGFWTTLIGPSHLELVYMLAWGLDGGTPGEMGQIPGRSGMAASLGGLRKGRHHRGQCCQLIP